MMDILEWGGRMQGTVPSVAVAAEVLSHGVSMMVANDGEEVDSWAGMRETTGDDGGRQTRGWGSCCMETRVGRKIT